MIIQLFLVIRVLFFLLKDFTVCSSSSSQPSSNSRPLVTQCTPCYLHDHVHRAWIPPRGGDSTSDNDTQESQETMSTSGSTNDENDSLDDKASDPNTNPSKEISRSSHKKVSSTTSPFRLLNEVRHEVLEHIHETDKNPSNESELLRTAESTSSSATSSTRSIVGGAATAVAKDPIPLEGAPIAGVDTNRVAPLSLRLLQESGEQEDEDPPNGKDATLESDDTKSQVAKLWWVNVWTQQLSDVNKLEVNEDGESEEEATSTFDIMQEADEKTDEAALVPPSDESDSLAVVGMDTESDENKTMDEYQTPETSASYVSTGVVSAPDLSIVIALGLVSLTRIIILLLVVGPCR